MFKLYSINRLLIFIFIYNFTIFLFSHEGESNIQGCHNKNKNYGHHCNLKKSLKNKNKKKIYKNKYNRKFFKYSSYPTNSNIGFYTLKNCNTNIDHVVSLKDAYVSGAKNWKNKLKEDFANDRANHVTSCEKINSSKGSSVPKDFLRKSKDGKGLDYEIIPFCAYLGIYYQVKTKYRLSFDNNHLKLFSKCGLNFQ